APTQLDPLLQLRREPGVHLQRVAHPEEPLHDGLVPAGHSGPSNTVNSACSDRACEVDPMTRIGCARSMQKSEIKVHDDVCPPTETTRVEILGSLSKTAVLAAIESLP